MLSKYQKTRVTRRGKELFISTAKLKLDWSTGTMGSSS